MTLTPGEKERYRIYLNLLRHKLSINTKFWISDRSINDYFQSHNLFFILAMGRSGTMFLSRLLNKEKSAAVDHEPVPGDRVAYIKAFYSEKAALKYIHNFRRKEIYLRVKDSPIQCYGEVNSTLRRHCLALKKYFDKAVLLHLVRNGKDVVRSIMNRWAFTPTDSQTYKAIAPPTNDPFREKWSSMSRFERVCWYWQVDNAYLRKHISNHIKFELLLSDYEYFVEYILEPLDLRITSAVWKKAVEKPVNVSFKTTFPQWSEWDRSLKDKFMKICGEEMIANGYEI